MNSNSKMDWERVLREAKVDVPVVFDPNDPVAIDVFVKGCDLYLMEIHLAEQGL